MEDTLSTLARHVQSLTRSEFEYIGLEPSALIERLESKIQNLDDPALPLFVFVNGLQALGEGHWDNGLGHQALASFLSMLCTSACSSSLRILFVTNGLPEVLSARMHGKDHHDVSHKDAIRKLSSLRFPQAESR